MLIYPYWDSRDLRALTDWLERCGDVAYPAMMLDLYPKGAARHADLCAGQDPTEVLDWFDAGNYTIRPQDPLGNLWIQGGPRARAFFADDPRKAPTLTKVPLVRWNRRFAYVNSAHTLLPPRLNRVWDRTGGEMGSGLLLHSKFLRWSQSARVKKRRGASILPMPSSIRLLRQPVGGARPVVPRLDAAGRVAAARGAGPHVARGLGLTVTIR